MKKIVFSLLCLFGLMPVWAAQDIAVAPHLPATHSPEDSSAPITLQFPVENGYTSSGAKAIYVFGKLHIPHPDQAAFDINGLTVYVYENGTFIAYVPVEQGEFELLMTARTPEQTYQAVRHIFVPGMPLSKLKEKAQFDEHSIYPRRPVWLLPGDTVQLSVRGTPGANVKAILSGSSPTKEISLQEDPDNPGTYQAPYVLPNDIQPQSMRVAYALVDPATQTRAKATARKHIKILDKDAPLLQARIKDLGGRLRQKPVMQGSLYPDYKAFGEVFVNGRDKGLFRLDLGNNETAWLEESKLTLISNTDFQPNHIASLQTISDEKQTAILWNITRQVPLSIHEFNNRLELTFYYTDLFEENFSFDTTSPILNRIEWAGPQDGVLTFTLYFQENELPWGYAYRYQDNQLWLILRHPPVITPSAEQPLLGARILIDAGHSPKRKPPYDGLVSPSGFLEYEVNLALAEALKPKLEAAGATVIMTREGNNHMNLTDRYEKAIAEDAHIFISLHHNAFTDTDNPLGGRYGYSIFYAYPHSFKLGEAVHAAFAKNIPLPDSGLLFNDVLFIPRISEMPSILIENAYMIFPQQETFVMSEQGRETFAETIYQGILNFYQNQINPSSEKKTKQTFKKKNKATR